VRNVLTIVTPIRLVEKALGGVRTHRESASAASRALLSDDLKNPNGKMRAVGLSKDVSLRNRK